LKPWWFRTTSHSCRCRRAHPNSTARKTSGSSCVRIGCQTGFSNPSTISSTTAATLGTHSSTSPGRLCPSRDATGQQSVTQSADWYKASQTILFIAPEITMPKENLSGMTVEALMDLRKRVDEMLLGRRAELEKQLERIAVGGGERIVRGRRSVLKERKVPPKYRSPSGE